MDAKDSYRRQKFDTIKTYLRSKRVPLFMREPILEFYERLLSQMDMQMGDEEVLGDLPSTLKVQLAVTQNADFLKGVSFFSQLEPRIIAALVLCLQSRIYMVSHAAATLRPTPLTALSTPFSCGGTPFLALPHPPSEPACRPSAAAGRDGAPHRRDRPRPLLHSLGRGGGRQASRRRGGVVCQQR